MFDAVNIIEIFSSIQGEGVYVGCRQVFVRLAECNLNCEYCDTPISRKVAAIASIEIIPGKRDFIEVPNPIGLAKVTQYINNLLKIPHHSVSFTGGEPLVNTPALIKLAPLVNAPIYLETNGTLPEQLLSVLPYIDIISMDIKLPSSCGKSFWLEHKQFLQLAVRKRVFVKLVVTRHTTPAEFMQAIELVSEIDKGITFIIQPVTVANISDQVLPQTILSYQEQALTVLKDVRVIPQTHKIIGQL